MSRPTRASSPARPLSWTYLRGESYTSGGVVAALLALPGVTDVMPAYDSTLVEYDGGALDHGALLAAADDAGESDIGPEQKEVEIPVLYGGEHGPDLAELAARAGLEEQRAGRLHASVTYAVRAIGFAPGFPFLEGVPGPLRKERQAEPRRRVPAHSVGVAGTQTGVYPVETPGGWNLIGRALTTVYDPLREEPFLLSVGDRVRFEPAGGSGIRSPPPPPSQLPLLPEEPMRPVLAVARQGLHDIVVDLGRLRVGRFGLARAGAMDWRAARLANLIVGNPAGAPLLEMTGTGPRLAVLADTVLAVTGPALAPELGSRSVDAYRGLRVAPGMEVGFTGTGEGVRSYLAVAGGLEVARFLGSASTDTRGLVGRPLRVGDVLGNDPVGPRVAGRGFRPHSFRFEPHAGMGRRRTTAGVRIRPGPQADPDAWSALLAGTFEVTAADRVGLRLAGWAVPGGEVRSEGTPLGAVQVPPGGDPLVLLNDRGTLGGYAKPAVVHPADLPVLAQLREGDLLRFRAA